MDILQWMLYFCIFGIGFVLGRITMAIQYAVMKPTAKEKKQKHEKIE